ncbi:MAG: type II secretion system F family protein [Vicinamibacterales bacterium]
MGFAIATFVICLVAVLGGYWAFVLRPEDRRSRAVTGRLAGVDRPQPAASGVTAAAAPRRSVPVLEALLARHAGLTLTLDRLLLEADVALSAGALVATCVATAVAGWSIGVLAVGRMSVAFGLAALAAAVPYLVVRRRRRRRLQVFEEQFPEAIDLVARALRAGHTFTTGLGIAADEMPAPVGSEFKRVYDQQNFGMAMPDALREMARRVPVLDARFFVTAVLTQRESGGNLAEVLDNLSSVMRDRFKVKRQIRVISAHGRLSGMILSIVPPALAAFLYVIQPQFMRVLVDDPLGFRLVMAAVGLQVLGTYAISRLVRIEY